jgi:acetate kinase
MGFTALDGLPMGTRCGQIDPGVLLYLMQEKGMGARQIEELLYKRSGLLGLSGVSNDMRQLERSADPWAAEAIDYFVYRIVRETGALAAVLGGIDGLIFTAGIGENSAMIRARVCAGLEWLGVRCDTRANEQHGPRISTPESRVEVWVIPTDEARMIAMHTARTILT